MRRAPFRAGSFYAADPSACAKHVSSLLNATPTVAGGEGSKVRCGLVPHAGWVYSGKVAAKTMKAVMGHLQKQRNSLPPPTVILFGADHVGTVKTGEVYDKGSWGTPLGDVPIDQDLASELIRSAAGGGSANNGRQLQLLRSNPAAHQREHSLEVQIPLLQQLVPGVRIVPIGVPVNSTLACEIGRVVGEYVAKNCRDGNVFILGSTDMTHTGGHFGYEGHGPGPQAEAFARANDARLLSLIEKMQTAQIVPEVERHGNACGGGAIAATMAAAQQLGATKGVVLEYTNRH